MNLLSRLSQRAPATELFAADGATVDLRSLRLSLQSRQSWLDSLANQGVAVAIRSPIELASALIALDGRVPQLLLLPEGLEQDDQSRFMDESRCSMLLTDAIWDSSGAHEVGGLTETARLPHADTEWYLPTSGTTGRPKLIPHTLASLTKTVKTDQKKGLMLKWGSLYAISRFAGLQVFLQSVLGGATLVLQHQDDQLDLVLERFVRFGVNAVSGTPTQWRKMLMSPVADQLQLKVVTLGGEIATQDTLDALHAKYPAAKISHVYASTEAGVGFSVSDEREGFPSEWLDDPRRAMAIDPGTGELLFANGKIRSGDVVVKRGSRLFFSGRINGAINVGGNKVMPERVETVLLSHPDVVAALVWGKQSAMTGNLVMADVVLRSNVVDRTKRAQELSAHCGKLLQRHEVPALFNFVPELNMNSSGKVVRRA